jgi:hypothetical protein
VVLAQWMANNATRAMLAISLCLMLSPLNGRWSGRPGETADVVR